MEHLGDLDVRCVQRRKTSESNASPSRLAVVLLHGFGAPGDDLVALADAIDAPDDALFVFPEAPIDLGQLSAFAMFGGARAWWLVDVGRFERAMARGPSALAELMAEEPKGLDEARAALDTTLDALAQKGLSRIFLGGFSQGAMLATDVALRSTRALEGLVLLSGTLIAEPVWRSRAPGRAGLRVFQSHGTSDPILPFPISERLRDMLAEAGLPVTFTAFDGGHTIAPHVLGGLGRWLRQ